MSIISLDLSKNIWDASRAPEKCPVCGSMRKPAGVPGVAPATDNAIAPDQTPVAEPAAAAATSPAIAPNTENKREIPFVTLCPVVLATPQPVYNLLECRHCRSRFLYPSPDLEALHSFYAPGYYGADWYKQEEKGRMFAQHELRLGFGEHFLDVGCNLGHFLHAVAHTSGCEAHGVEISPEAVAYAREKLLLDVFCGELPDAGFPDQFFGGVRVNNVLEHVRDPLSFLRECHRIMLPEANLYLSVPNGYVDSADLLNYYRSEKKPPRSKDGHLFFFSREALELLFHEAGFVVSAAHTYGLRRGLRSLGRYPKKRHWKTPYRLTKPPAPGHEAEKIVLAPQPRRLPGYALYRYWQFRVKRLSGMASFGLDYEILLKAR